jgi:hypothetical protein
MRLQAQSITPKTKKAERQAALSGPVRADLELWLRRSPGTGPEGRLSPIRTTDDSPRCRQRDEAIYPSQVERDAFLPDECFY